MINKDEIIKKLQIIINDKDTESLQALFDEYNIVDMAEVISELEVRDLVYIFKVLDKVMAGDLFSYMSFERQNRLADLMTSAEISAVLDYVYTDDAILFLEELPRTMTRNILNNTNKERRDLLKQMLSYPEDSAGSVMSTDYIEIGQYLTVEEATQLIKTHEGIAEMMDTYYVTDINKVLVGVVSIREILFAPEDESIETVMTKEVISVNSLDNQEDVTKVLAKYDLSSIPVIDDSNRFLGFISADDIMDIVEEEATEDMFKMGGITSAEGSYLETSAKDMAKSRVLWLLILTVAYTLSSFIITGFDDLITALPSLMIFVPLLMDTAGDAGSQALAMVVRGIAVDGIDTSYFKQIATKEFGVALISGAVLFVGNLIRIMFFSTNTGDFWLAFVVSITVFFVVIIAKLIGGILPLVALYFKQDPAAMASPLITTLSDSVSLLLYFSIARFFIERLV